MTIRRGRPVLTIAEYLEATRLFRLEVANVAWSLVVSPAPVGELRRWRALSPGEAEDVFARLLSAITRHAAKDAARIVERRP